MSDDSGEELIRLQPSLFLTVVSRFFDYLSSHCSNVAWDLRRLLCFDPRCFLRVICHPFTHCLTAPQHQASLDHLTGEPGVPGIHCNLVRLLLRRCLSLRQ